MLFYFKDEEDKRAKARAYMTEYRAKNRERLNEQRRQRYEKSKVLESELQATGMKKKYPKRPQTEKDRARNLKRYRDNRDKLLAKQKLRQRQRYKENREEILNKQRLRRAEEKKRVMPLVNDTIDNTVLLHDVKLRVDKWVPLTDQLEAIVNQL